ncbi:hypothetical protein HDU86_003155 [Geranomyces michiganensis]|nr:hypothetical protein HDU86_003155 [Geranomyces michiganensis]
MSCFLGQRLNRSSNPQSRPFFTTPKYNAFAADTAPESLNTEIPAEGPDSSLVSTSWLANNLDKVVVIDATWYLNPQQTQKGKVGMDDDFAFIPDPNPKPPKDGRKEFAERHIQGARFFDLDEVSDPLSPLPHMLPTLEDFEDAVSKMGIKETDHIVVYDAQGIFSAPRVWWTFKVFGHKHVSVLDGGLPKWLAEHRPVVSTAETFPESKYRCEYREDMVIDYQDMLLHVTDFMYSKNFTIIDARPSARFAGFAPEPRPSLSSGHIPSSINIPASELIDPETKTMLPRKDIIRRLIIEKIDMDRPLVTMCGSGVTAAIVFLALDLVGKRGDVKLFDGSWTEWASKSKSPIKKWT